jgi:hypothetical protein
MSVRGFQQPWQARMAHVMSTQVARRTAVTLGRQNVQSLQ